MLNSLSPLVSKYDMFDKSTGITDLTLKSFESESMFAKCDPEYGQFMACCLIYRGNIHQADANEAMAAIKSKKTISFVDWCPTGFKCGFNSSPLGTVNDGDVY